jgi:hypothetical protein
MAKVSSVTTTAFVIDTSYLLELYEVPKHFDPEKKVLVRKKLAQATKAKSCLYVPLPVVFEVANKIGLIADAAHRDDLADRFVDAVLASFQPTGPFTITPAIEQAPIESLLRVFKETYVMKGLGLTDTSVVGEANRLKERYGSMSKVHIWRLDRALKGQEPDKEPDPFVG